MLSVRSCRASSSGVDSAVWSSHVSQRRARSQPCKILGESGYVEPLEQWITSPRRPRGPWPVARPDEPRTQDMQGKAVIATMIALFGDDVCHMRQAVLAIGVHSEQPDRAHDRRTVETKDSLHTRIARPSSERAEKGRRVTRRENNIKDQFASAKNEIYIKLPIKSGGRHVIPGCP